MNDWLTQNGFLVGCETEGRASLSETTLPDGRVESVFSLSWDAEAACSQDATLSIHWNVPCVDMMYQWTPLCCPERALSVDWYGPRSTKTALDAPVICYFNDLDQNTMTVAVSETRREVKWKFGVREEDGTLSCTLRLPLAPFGTVCDYELRLIVDRSPVPYYEALDRVRRWWEDTCGLVPAAVPAVGKQPMYSTWYSFHQDMTAQRIEEECARAAALGLKCVIVDDGWQTSDNNRGYAYTGDWEVAAEKFPDMAAHVARVHSLGMKYMLWYSLPFIGNCAKRYKEFEDKFLWIDGNHGVLDPRYTVVRDFLKNLYVTALKEWDLDGFKLDFIDWITLPQGVRAEKKPGMDFLCPQEALDFLMKDLLATLREIKPDILIEFRQGYIGPNIRQYGNLFRVGDCPNNFIRNRAGIVDLRLLGGDSAIHSDMLMWHPDELVENSAIQMESVLFGVLQLSVALDRQDEEHRRMITYWLEFMRRHQHLLQEAKMIAESPHFLYPVIRVEEEQETLVARYSGSAVVKLDAGRFTRVTLVNATKTEELTLRFTGNGTYAVSVLDCCGREVSRETWEAADGGTAVVRLPKAGLAVLEAE